MVIISIRGRLHSMLNFIRLLTFSVFASSFLVFADHDVLAPLSPEIAVRINTLMKAQEEEEEFLDVTNPHITHELCSFLLQETIDPHAKDWLYNTLQKQLYSLGNPHPLLYAGLLCLIPLSLISLIYYGGANVPNPLLAPIALGSTLLCASSLTYTIFYLIHLPKTIEQWSCIQRILACYKNNDNKS